MLLALTAISNNAAPPIKHLRNPNPYVAAALSDWAKSGLKGRLPLQNSPGTATTGAGAPGYSELTALGGSGTGAALPWAAVSPDEATHSPAASPATEASVKPALQEMLKAILGRPLGPTQVGSSVSLSLFSVSPLSPLPLPPSPSVPCHMCDPATFKFPLSSHGVQC